MNFDKFNKIVERRCDLIKSVLAKKGAEYADADALSNFKRGAAITGGTSEEVLLGYMTKHLVSVIDLIKGKNNTEEVATEKIGDTINYLILLEGLLKERREGLVVNESMIPINPDKKLIIPTNNPMELLNADN